MTLDPFESLPFSIFRGRGKGASSFSYSSFKKRPGLLRCRLREKRATACEVGRREGPAHSDKGKEEPAFWLRETEKKEQAHRKLRMASEKREKPLLQPMNQKGNIGQKRTKRPRGGKSHFLLFNARFEQANQGNTWSRGKKEGEAVSAPCGRHGTEKSLIGNHRCNY